MSDQGLRQLQREVAATADGAGWARLARARLRTGDLAGAGQAALAASAWEDVGDVLDALTPPLEAFEARRIPGWRSDLGDFEWCPEGESLCGVVPRGRRSPEEGELVELSLSGEVRRIRVDDLSRLSDFAVFVPPRGPWVVSARLAVDPRGEWLIHSCRRRGDVTLLQTVSRSTGEVLSRFAPSSADDQVWELAPTASGVLACHTSEALSLFQLDPAGRPMSTEPSARLKLERPGLTWRPPSSVDPCGAMVRCTAKRVGLHDPGVTKPRRWLARSSAGPTARLARRRVVIESEGWISLHAPGGEVLAGGQRVPAQCKLYPSPSGRLVAIVHGSRPARVQLRDLRTGRKREWPCGAQGDPIGGVRWSPSGSRLLVRGGSLHLITA